MGGRTEGLVNVHLNRNAALRRRVAKHLAQRRAQHAALEAREALAAARPNAFAPALRAAPPSGPPVGPLRDGVEAHDLVQVDDGHLRDVDGAGLEAGAEHGERGQEDVEAGGSHLVARHARGVCVQQGRQRRRLRARGAVHICFRTFRCVEVQTRSFRCTQARHDTLQVQQQIAHIAHATARRQQPGAPRQSRAES